jgi:predicted DNA-binding transcriptional regulator YafY
MYFPTTRVLIVLELLQSRPSMSGRELAERLEVDIRTIRRYITMLQDLGIPVEAERGRYGAYHLRPGFKLPPLMFTDDEAFSLTLGLLAARKMGVTLAAPAVDGAIAKIERVLPAALRERVQAVQETLVFDFAPARSVPRKEFVVLLSEATQRCKNVWLHYRAYESVEDSERVVDPYGLVCRSGYWYLVGYCHLRSDLRTFRLDRILDVKMHTETFERPPAFDCLAFVVQSLPKTPNTWLVEVLLEMTLSEAQRTISPALATLEEATEGVALRCYVDRLDWIACTLVSLGRPFTVLQPTELRDELRLLAERVSALAERT